MPRVLEKTRRRLAKEGSGGEQFATGLNSKPVSLPLTTGTPLRFVASAGARYTNALAAVLGSELEQMYREERAINPESLVLRATDPAHLLHPLFEWDDREAAREYRLYQARSVINHLEIVVRDAAGAEVRVKAVLSIPMLVRTAEPDEEDEEGDDEEIRRRVYLPVRTVQSDPALRAEMLRQARAELLSWRRKYDLLGLEELSAVYRFIDGAVKAG